MGRRGQRRSGGTRIAQRSRRVRDLDNEGIIPVLARAVREVENGVARGDVRRSLRTKFQVIGLLVREERDRVRADAISEAKRGEQLKKIDAIATVMARTAARDSTLLTLLADDRGRPGLGAQQRPQVDHGEHPAAPVRQPRHPGGQAGDAGQGRRPADLGDRRQRQAVPAGAEPEDDTVVSGAGPVAERVHPGCLGRRRPGLEPAARRRP